MSGFDQQAGNSTRLPRCLAYFADRLRTERPTQVKVNPGKPLFSGFQHKYARVERVERPLGRGPPFRIAVEQLARRRRDVHLGDACPERCCSAYARGD